MTSVNPAGKETIYIDIDDEITGVIDKVRGSQQKIVALVLPKRATVFQSVVNMKLLKRTADNAKKNLVLITSEASLLPLAGGVGIHVAKNLQTKPEIPPAPRNLGDAAENIDEAPLALDDERPKEPNLDASKPVGDLAAGTIAPTAVEDTIELDSADPDAPVASAKGSAGANKANAKKNKQLKIPNFSKFRLLLIVGIAAIVVIILASYLCFSVLPKASIDVKTNSSAIASNLDLTLNPAANAVDADAGVVPAQSQQVQKTYTQQVPATGQQNNGAKASGSATIVNCSGSTLTLPAGTGFSNGNLTYISQTPLTLSDSNYNHGGTCKSDSHGTVNVVAQNGGASYNTGQTNLTIANAPAGTSASTSGISGGTDNITKIVQQSDIDGAKQKLQSQDTSAIKQQLQNTLQQGGSVPIAATFNAGAPNSTTSANVGDAADTVTVTEAVTYTMYGAKHSDLAQIVKNNVDKQIDTAKQVITDDGLSQATFKLQNQDNGTVSVSMSDTAVAGPDLKVDQLKQQVAGKKSGDAESIIKATPGVTDVTVHYSPFWVSAIPNKTGKISITIEKPTTTNGQKQ
ncbi:MAG TPA: hypothetical protein VHT70_04480 [Candidatus Saccharimonadales bacterium]|jgi:hypothetical protein|nr:hypothetical protein [Candidatus Saccharimonadales bacterium]